MINPRYLTHALRQLLSASPVNNWDDFVAAATPMLALSDAADDVPSPELIALCIAFVDDTPTWDSSAWAPANVEMLALTIAVEALRRPDPAR